MTQAFNLSQLANNLNSSGQLDATDGLVNAVPIANGGTGNSIGAAVSIQTANFTVLESGGKLVFQYGATTIASIDSSGNLTTLGSVDSSSTP